MCTAAQAVLDTSNRRVPSFVSLKNTPHWWEQHVLQQSSCFHHTNMSECRCECVHTQSDILYVVIHTCKQYLRVSQQLGPLLALFCGKIPLKYKWLQVHINYKHKIAAQTSSILQPAERKLKSYVPSIHLYYSSYQSWCFGLFISSRFRQAIDLLQRAHIRLKLTLGWGLK